MSNKQNDTGNDGKPTHSSKDLWYCWSHGIMHVHMINPGSAHHSDACKYPAKGHVTTATLYNMCGGNNYFRRIPEERAVYKHETYNDKKRKCKGKKETPDKPKTTEE